MAGKDGKIKPRLDLKFAAEIIVSLKIRFGQQVLDKGMAVHVRLSPLCRVTPDELRRAVRKVAELAEIGRVRLEIAPLEFEVHCEDCGGNSMRASPAIFCPLCHGTNVVNRENGQFRIDSIEPLCDE